MRNNLFMPQYVQRADSALTIEDNSMKTIAVVALAVMGAIGVPALYAADSDASYPGMYVKDSAIPTKVKTKLLAKEPTTLSNVKVNTDRDGVVWLWTCPALVDG